MKHRSEYRSRFFARNPRFNYLPAEDRYLFHIEPPKYKFNSIGTGINGQEHMRVTFLEGRAVINGIYDPNPGSIETAKQVYSKFAPADNLVVYDSLEAACNEPDVDGLIISTPNYTHIDVFREAIKSGKHIFLEKPMATTIQDAYEMTRLAKEYPAVFQVGLQYRYKAINVEAIHEALVRKTIGEIKTISIQEHRIPFLDKVKQWNKFSKYSGGTLVEKCCHYFDLFNLYAQAKPVSVYATGSMAVNFIDFEYEGEKSDILDNAFVTVIYENGIRANFGLVMFSPMFYEELVLCGDEGRLKVVERVSFYPDTRAKTELEITQGEGMPSRVSYPAYPTMIEESGHRGSTFYEHIFFVDNIEGKETNTATVDEGFWSIVIGAAAEESVKTGQVVNIDELLARNGITDLPTPPQPW
jgi:predicted dehydrogenase